MRDGRRVGRREGVIVPIVKKGERRVVRDYRGVTVMSTLYKAYASMLVERLREEVGKKKIIPRTQTEFRKRIGTLDNIYVLDYVVNKPIGRVRGKLITLFVDLGDI